MSKTLKKDSRAWQLAKRYERLKHARNFRAIDISPDGKTVAFQAMIYGNVFFANESEIAGMIRRAKGIYQ